MGWREDIIDRHRGEIARMRESVEWLKTGTSQVGEVSSSGKLASLNEELIAHYQRTIDALELVVASLEAENF
jgi:hypothetical protein